MALKLVLQRFLQLLSENVHAPTGQFIVEIGDDEVQRNLDFDVHCGWLVGRFVGGVRALQQGLQLGERVYAMMGGTKKLSTPSRISLPNRIPLFN